MIKIMPRQRRGLVGRNQFDLQQACRFHAINDRLTGTASSPDHCRRYAARRSLMIGRSGCLGFSEVIKNMLARRGKPGFARWCANRIAFLLGRTIKGGWLAKHHFHHRPQRRHCPSGNAFDKLDKRIWQRRQSHQAFNRPKLGHRHITNRRAHHDAR